MPTTPAKHPINPSASAIAIGLICIGYAAFALSSLPKPVGLQTLQRQHQQQLKAFPAQARLRCEASLKAQLPPRLSYQRFELTYQPLQEQVAVKFGARDQSGEINMAEAFCATIPATGTIQSAVIL